MVLYEIAEQGKLELKQMLKIAGITTGLVFGAGFTALDSYFTSDEFQDHLDLLIPTQRVKKLEFYNSSELDVDVDSLFNKLEVTD